MDDVQRPRPVDGSSGAFLEAMTHVRLAEIACRDAWLEARSGEAVARRRYRAALRHHERVLLELRNLDMIPREMLASVTRRSGAAGPS